ncbi:MFS transporter [Thermogymnomonas acidicola]|uniref:MFS transporter n=1 Tax=Thermogymnomonas acidicola TaxID=399579 RepID=A0AA37BPM3_9ARCH|nr:MFS transporter [Thermogymnomonas acidicola]
MGIIFTLNSATSIVFSIVGGALSDRIGRKGTLLTGSLSGVLIYAAIFADLIGPRQAASIVALFILSAISGALVFPSASALVADVTTEDERTDGYVIYRIMSNLGWAIGPIAGGVLYEYHFSLIFMMVSVTSLMQFLTIVFFVRNVKARQNTAKKRSGYLVFDRYLLTFSLGTFFLTIVTSQFSVTLPVYSSVYEGITGLRLGLVYAVNGTVVVLGQMPITSLMKRFDDVTTMMAGAAAYALGYLLVGFSGSFYQLMLDMAIITVGEDMTSPIMNTIVSRIAPPDRVGRYMGFLGMMNSTGRALGPSVGSFLLFIFSFERPLVWVGVDIFALTSVLLFTAFRAMLLRRDRLSSPSYGYKVQ